jgi:NAD(P)-dependent dehydrogenase (short-subunit alcohol dehydrogenase family)
MMECVRPELEARGVICSAFCPGAVQSNIAAAGKTRPADLAETGYAEADKRRAAGGNFMHLYQTKEEVGERVLQGILNDELYILTHSEFLDGVRERGEATTAAVQTHLPKTRITSRPSRCCSAIQPVTAEIARQDALKARTRSLELHSPPPACGRGAGVGRAVHQHRREKAHPDPSRKREGGMRRDGPTLQAGGKNAWKDFAGRTASREPGGANGVGIGLVRQLLNEGCKVAIADIRQDSIDQALEDARQPRSHGRPARRGQPRRLQGRGGRGRGRGRPCLDPVQQRRRQSVPADRGKLLRLIWDWLMGVNLHGVINGPVTFVPGMVARVKAGEQKGGHVVNTASIAGVRSPPARPGIDSATKFPVRLAFRESLHYSLLQYEIGVSVLCPGLVKSYIYASDDIRPDELEGAMKPVNAEAVERDRQPSTNSAWSPTSSVRA